MINPAKAAARLLLLATAAAALSACGGDDNKEKTGFLTVGVTDAPVDNAESVVVKFTGVEIKPKGGPAKSIDFATAKEIDLLDQQGMTRAVILDGEEVAAGEYEWLRLKVAVDPNVIDDSYVRLTKTGQECEMRIPSGAETGLKLVRGFTVGVGAVTDFTIDFDLRKSLVAPPGQETEMDSCNDSNQVYLLKPALRVVDNLRVGAIGGTVDSNLVAAAGCRFSPPSVVRPPDRLGRKCRSLARPGDHVDVHGETLPRNALGRFLEHLEIPIYLRGNRPIGDDRSKRRIRT